LTVSDNLISWPDGWWTFGNDGVFASQALAITGPRAKWPNGAAVGEHLAWAPTARILIGLYSEDPPSIGFGDTAPTSGYHVRGSVSWNTEAASGQPMGWQCTVTGTPGTWVAMPDLP
jgi:hypothetical protein